MHGSGPTFAFGHADLNGHVLRVQRAPETQSGRVPRILVASRINERLKGRCARGKLNSPSMDLVNERNCGQGGSEGPEGGHVENV